jgi:hypothetical protein
MAQAAIRFGVVDGHGHRASSWKCWVETGRGKNDIYLTCRNLRAFKASFHESGSWHVAFDSQRFPSMFEDADRPPSRFAMQWSRPPELAPGVLLLCRVLVPWYAPTVADSQLDSTVTWVQTAPHGKALEFAVIITSAATRVSDWPGRRSMNTHLVGSVSLESGDRVWVVYHVIEWTDPPAVTGRPRFGRGKTAADLRRQGLRAVALRRVADSSIAFLDAPVKVSQNRIDS